MRIIDVDTGDLMLEVEYMIFNGDESVGCKPEVEFWAYLLEDEAEVGGVMFRQGDDVSSFLSRHQERAVIDACFEDEKRWIEESKFDA